MLDSIYSSVPVPSYVSAEAVGEVRRFLRESPERFFTAREIALATGLPTKGTQVEVRRAITELIELRGCPIVSCHAGFAWTGQESRLARYQGSLEERAAGLDRRIRAIAEIRAGLRGPLRVEDLRDYLGGRSSFRPGFSRVKGDAR